MQLLVPGTELGRGEECQGSLVKTLDYISYLKRFEEEKSSRARVIVLLASLLLEEIGGGGEELQGLLKSSWRSLSPEEHGGVVELQVPLESY